VRGEQSGLKQPILRTVESKNNIQDGNERKQNGSWMRSPERESQKHLKGLVGQVMFSATNSVGGKSPLISLVNPCAKIFGAPPINKTPPPPYPRSQGPPIVMTLIKEVKLAIAKKRHRGGTPSAGGHALGRWA